MLYDPYAEANVGTLPHLQLEPLHYPRGSFF